MLQIVLKSKVTISELYMNWKMSSAAKVLYRDARKCRYIVAYMHTSANVTVFRSEAQRTR